MADEKKEVITENKMDEPRSTIMNNAQWEGFAKGDLINFLVLHNLQKIVVDDGAGKKATAKINSKGEYCVTYTTTEVM